MTSMSPAFTAHQPTLNSPSPGAGQHLSLADDFLHHGNTPPYQLTLGTPSPGTGQQNSVADDFHVTSLYYSSADTEFTLLW
jgi:hypothetical protein